MTVARGRSAVTLLMGFYLTQLLLFSTYSCWRNQQAYLHTSPPVPPLLSRLVEHGLLRALAHTCGYASGYGFYAPRVGSHFLTEFRLHTADGRHTTQHYPTLKTLEGRIRYRAFTDLFSTLLPQAHQPTAGAALHRRVSRAVARSLSERLAARQAVAQVACRVGVWYPAPLHLTDARSNSHYVELFHTHSRP